MMNNAGGPQGYPISVLILMTLEISLQLGLHPRTRQQKHENIEDGPDL